MKPFGIALAIVEVRAQSIAPGGPISPRDNREVSPKSRHLYPFPSATKRLKF